MNGRKARALRMKAGGVEPPSQRKYGRLKTKYGPIVCTSKGVRAYKELKKCS